MEKVELLNIDLEQYERNSIIWQAGDIVIHDADSKRHYMLMVVIKITRYCVTTKYLHPDHMIPHAGLCKYGSFNKMPAYLKKRYQKTYYHINYPGCKGMAYLHDPKRFNIIVTDQDRAEARKVAGL